MAQGDYLSIDRTAALGLNTTTPPTVLTPRLHVDLYRTTAVTAVAGADPSAATVALTNWGTSFNEVGSVAVVTVTGATNIVLNVRAANTGGQSGTVSVELYDGTNSLVTLTFSDTTLQDRTASAAIATSGLRHIYARVKSSAATDDPLFNYIGLELTY